MGQGRLEAFSDGVIAIIITIMVLELKVPHETSLEALRPLAPIFLSYVLSFIYLGIYWSNHHHLLQVVRQVNGSGLCHHVANSRSPYRTGYEDLRNYKNQNQTSRLLCAVSRLISSKDVQV